MNSRPRIVITGGSGFIGTNAVSHFGEIGYTVLSLDRREPQNERHLEKWRECDVADIGSLRALIVQFRPDYILHLASRTDLDGGTAEEYSVNHVGVRNILDVASEAPGLRRIIFASSRMVCPIGYVPRNEEDYDPPNAYGVSKALGERIIRRSKAKVEWVIARPTSVWGPWFGVPYRNFFETIARGLYFHPAGYDPAKSFGYVENTIYQLERLFEASAEMVAGRTFYLCDYTPLRVWEWARMIEQEFGARRVVTVPMLVLRGAARVGDVCKLLGWLDAPITSFRLQNLITDMVFDTSELAGICGPLPFTLEDGVKRTVAWLTTKRTGEKKNKLRDGSQRVSPCSS